MINNRDSRQITILVNLTIRRYSIFSHHTFDQRYLKHFQLCGVQIVLAAKETQATVYLSDFLPAALVSDYNTDMTTLG